MRIFVPEWVPVKQVLDAGAIWAAQPWGARAALSGFQTETVTRMHVAGIAGLPSVLLFCDRARSTILACSSPVLPFFSGASKAFIVEPP